MKLDWTEHGDEIAHADRCPACGGETQRVHATIGGAEREVLVCPRHGFVATRQNRSLVRRILEQVGNLGDAIRKLARAPRAGRTPPGGRA